MSFLPLWIRLLVIGGLCLLAVASCRYRDGLLRDEGVQSERAAQRELDRLQAEADQGETARRIFRNSEISHDTAQSLAAAAADRDRADLAARSLRAELAAYAQAHRCADPAAGTDQPPADTALDVLAHLFAGPDQAAGELAQFADRARAAGLGCERTYDALTQGAAHAPTR